MQHNAAFHQGLHCFLRLKQPSETEIQETCVKWGLLKRPKIGFQDQLLLNAGQKYCRMLQEEHSAILLTFIELPFVIKIIVLFIFQWLFYTGFTVHHILENCTCDPLVYTMGIPLLLESYKLENPLEYKGLKC